VTRVAAIDCGTNSLRLLVADLDPVTGRAVDVERRTTIVRLGQDVDRTGRFAEEALRRVFRTLDEFVDVIETTRPDHVRFVGTSAVRDVSNRQTLLDGVVARLGVAPDVISGPMEAQLSYDGVTRGLAARTGSDFAEPYVVVDIGGGSTELVSRPLGHDEVRTQSLDIGSVRITERHLHGDPPTAVELAAAVHDIDAAIETAQLSEVGTLIGVAGTVTTMAAMVLALPEYNRDQIHHARLPTEDLLASCHEVVGMTVAERRRFGFMDPGRADVIGGGALVVAAVVRRAGVDALVASEHDLLDGIAWSLL
jgi:exopolyphosphatase/guanosine-5'-triphosphate,3'-diphosphate pyrophosphatase